MGVRGRVKRTLNAFTASRTIGKQAPGDAALSIYNSKRLGSARLGVTILRINCWAEGKRVILLHPSAGRQC